MTYFPAAGRRVEPGREELGAICPQPDDPRCTDMTPCDDCCSISKWEPPEPYTIEDEPPGSPIFLPGGTS